ncbi:MAG TPA: hypothetical protein VNS09_22945 [Solirubrobacter sp.]|nr:hypothetical protein [Solirubrobacter sp.]
MRSRLILLAACAVALVLPASASAAFTVGISENEPKMFSDPLFAPVGFKEARVIAGYDVALDPGGFEFARIRDYLAAAKAAGVEPLVSFQHTRGDSSRCNQKRYIGKGICKLPSQKAYEKAMKAFFAAFPTAKVISPWNEANHFTQPTSRNPGSAAKFTNTVAKLCPTCKLVVADILDQADDPKAKNPKFTETEKWIKAFRKSLKVKRGICGIHNYSDVNRFRSSGTAAIIKALGCKEYWLTETGGLYDFGSFWSKKTYHGCKSSSSCQVKATKYMFTLTKKYKQIKRLYVYTWFGGVTPRFDAGLVADGKPRAALAEIRKYVKS